MDTKTVPSSLFTMRFLATGATLANSCLETKLQLKKFAHFTLGCTSGNQIDVIREKFNGLASFLEHHPLTLKSKETTKLCDRLWVLKLDVPEELRSVFSKLFDHLICSDGFGTFLWKEDLSREGSTYNAAPHITFGPTEADKELAQKFVGSSITFTRIDYKQIGPHDPILTIELK